MRTRPPSVVPLSGAQRQQLLKWARGRTTPHRVVRRSRIIVMAAEGHSEGEIAARLHTTRATVQLWRERFLAGGVETLWKDAPGRGRKPTISPDTISGVLEAAQGGDATGRKPSVRALAEMFGISPASVYRILHPTAARAPVRAGRRSAPGATNASQF